MTDVPRTSPERPVIWSQGRPATGSCRRPMDVAIQNFCIFVFPVKNSNRCLKQELLHLKITFSLNYDFFLLVPQESSEGPLEVPDVRTFRGPAEDVPETSRASWECSKRCKPMKTYTESLCCREGNYIPERYFEGQCF